MNTANPKSYETATSEILRAENERLRRRLEEAEETLTAIRSGAIDAVVVEQDGISRIYTLVGADRPYRLFVEEMHQGAATLHSDGTIAWCNRQLAHLLQVPQTRLVGASLRDFVCPDGQAVYDRLLQESQSQGGKAETQLQRSDGTLVPVFLTFNKLPENCGSAIGVLVTDLTPQRRHEELENRVTERTSALRATNQQLEAFVYSIAHDLRAPLRSMQGFSEMLLEQAGTSLDADARNLARRISNSAQFMDALLQDLLAFSRMAQQAIQLVPVEIETVVAGVISRLEKEIRERGAEVEIAAPLPSVLAHEPTLGQVFFNLISNALKFVSPGVTPLVRIYTEFPSRGEKSAAGNQGTVRVWVEDNGIGIAPEHHEQIFRLFTRLQGNTYGGTGVGLAIVHKGIERMDGCVGVDSATGKGSRFWFELRRAEPVE